MFLKGLKGEGEESKTVFFNLVVNATYIKGGSRHKNLCMTRVLGFLIRYFSNYYTLHRSDLAARAAPLDPRLAFVSKIAELTFLVIVRGRGT